MSEALGWNRTVLTGALTLQHVGNMAVTPVVGVLLDRYGPKVIMVIGAVVAAVCFVLIAGISEPWQFYLLYTAATVLGLHELGSLVTSTTVAKWFVRLRGRAMALSSIGLNVGAVIMAPLIAVLINGVGWRSTWMALGIIVAVVVIPPALAVFRRSPEDMGLLPDGDRRSPAANVARSGGQPHASAEHQWRLNDALRNPTTWQLVVAFNLLLVAVSAVSLHTVAYFLDAGLSLTEASAMFALTHVFTIGAKLVWGFLSDRVPVRYCIVGSNLARVVGLLFLLLGVGQWRIYAFVVGNGIGQGMGLLQPKLWADYYGRTFLGTIRGVLQPFSVLASLAGPLFAAYVSDTVGSYDPAYWVLIVSLLISSVLMYLARPPGAPPVRPSPAP